MLKFGPLGQLRISFLISQNFQNPFCSVPDDIKICKKIVFKHVVTLHFKGKIICMKRILVPVLKWNRMSMRQSRSAKQSIKISAYHSVIHVHIPIFLKMFTFAYFCKSRQSPGSARTGYFCPANFPRFFSLSVYLLSSLSTVGVFPPTNKIILVHWLPLNK